MYDKLILKKLPIPKLPKARKEDIYNNDKIGFIVRSSLAINDNLLIVSFYERESAANGFSLPTATLYIAKTGYTTRLNLEGKSVWRTGRIRRVLGIEGIYPSPNVICFRHADEDRIRNFLRRGKPKTYVNYNGIDYYIEAHQNIFVDKRREEKWKEQREEYDTVMNTVPTLPANFTSWLNNVPFKKGRHVFYKRLNDRIAKGFCSHCRNDFLLDSKIPRHNKEGVCPQCGSEISYKATSRSTSLLYTANACIAQKIKTGGVVLRYFWLDRDFRSDRYSWQMRSNYRSPSDYITEMARLFIDSDGKIIGKYRLGYLNFLHGYGFRASEDVITGDNRDYYKGNTGIYSGLAINIWFRAAYMYTHNLRGILNQYSLPYSLQHEMVTRQPLDVTTYLCQHIRYPVISSFDNLGLNCLKNDLLKNGQELKAYNNKGSLHNRLGISKEQLSMASENGFTTYHINILTSSLAQPSLENLLWLGKHEFDFRIINTILQYTTLHKMKKYIQQQCKVVKDDSLYRYDNTSKEHLLARYWADYLIMSNKLNFQTKKWRILFPKDVKDQHDKVNALCRVKYDPVMDEKVKKAYPALNAKYSFENDELFLRPIKDFNGFVEEGAELMHCVASSGYYRYHVDGSSYIFSIRRLDDPDTAYYTMEYDPKAKKIKQLRGYKDCAPTDNVAAFRDEWLHAMGYKKRSKKKRLEAA